MKTSQNLRMVPPWVVGAIVSGMQKYSIKERGERSP
jgi:hypothetical protein